jgi:adenylate kinase family enzyme
VRLHLTGASGSGVTTLGAAIAARLGVPQHDVDDAFWLPTDPPFTSKRPEAERIAQLAPKLAAPGWVLSGSCDGWGAPLVAQADAVVLVEAPAAVRMARLKARETALFGARITPGGDMRAGHLAFLDWAAGYDDPDFAGRSRARHLRWTAGLPQPFRRVDGTRPVAALADEVTQWLETLA